MAHQSDIMGGQVYSANILGGQMYAEIGVGYVSGEGRGFPSGHKHSVLNTTRNLKRYNGRSRDGDEGAGRDRLVKHIHV